MNPHKILELMADIEKQNPLALEYETDARDIWPTRWNVLKKIMDIAIEVNEKKAIK